MQIQIVDVGTPNTHAGKNGRSYQSIEVMYKDESGKAASKKLMSFSNPSVFKAISTMTKGDVVNVVTQKDDNGYWQWTGINEGGGEAAPKAQATATQGATRVTGSNYETKEERAARQRLIVRQSSLTAALATLTPGAKSVDKEAVKALAEEYSAWVFEEGAASSSDPMDGLDNDIPF